MAPRFALLLAVTLLHSAASTLSGCGSVCPPSGSGGGGGSGGGSGGRGGGNSGSSCPIDTLKLEVCADVLNLLRLKIGMPDGEQCCPLLQGLADLDAAVCLCLAIRANVLRIVLNIPVDLTLLLNYCHKDRVAGFVCPAN
ncbi:unnamed protein product [Urochloa humidicola]